MRVWTFWTGDPPSRISTCLSTIERNCSDWRHLDSDDAEKILEGKVHPIWKRLLPAHQADVLRACVLSLYGGLWIDADTVMFRDPVDYFGDIRKFAYTVWGNLPRRVLNGYVYSPRPNHPIALSWFSRVSLSVSQMSHWSDRDIKNLEKTNWTRFGEKCLTPSITEEDSFQYPLETFLPLDVDRSSPLFFENLQWESFVTPQTIGFGLSNSYIEAREHKINERTLVYRLLEFAQRSLE